MINVPGCGTETGHLIKEPVLLLCFNINLLVYVLRSMKNDVLASQAPFGGRIFDLSKIRGIRQCRGNIIHLSCFPA